MNRAEGEALRGPSEPCFFRRWRHDDFGVVPQLFPF